MATILKDPTAPLQPLPFLKDLKVAIVVAEWNAHITDKLSDGATTLFYNLGYPSENISIYNVPGAVELTYAAAQLARTKEFHAIIVFGCVIRGDTPHFDYVCQSVTQGVTQLNASQEVPIIFGVLTVENEQQALDRAGGILGNKGTEAAECAIKMCDFAWKLQ